VGAVSERGGGGCTAVGAVAIEGDNDKPTNKADAAAPPGNATHAFFSSLLGFKREGQGVFELKKQQASAPNL
jgi:hypothetical protein